MLNDTTGLNNYITSGTWTGSNISIGGLSDWTTNGGGIIGGGLWTGNNFFHVSNDTGWQAGTWTGSTFTLNCQTGGVFAGGVGGSVYGPGPIFKGSNLTFASLTQINAGVFIITSLSVADGYIFGGLFICNGLAWSATNTIQNPNTQNANTVASCALFAGTNYTNTGFPTSPPVNAGSWLSGNGSISVNGNTYAYSSGANPWFATSISVSSSVGPYPSNIVVGPYPAINGALGPYPVGL
jgi:hypothetical protein